MNMVQQMSFHVMTAITVFLTLSECIAPSIINGARTEVSRDSISSDTSPPRMPEDSP